MCGVSEAELKQLAEPFNPRALKWRVGSTSGDKTKGLALPYIEARHVMHRLDEVCGPGSWANEYKPGPIGGIMCGISVLVKDRDGASWITKWDGAPGTGGDQDVKGGISASFKRSAVHWGIGRYLYALPKYWVKIQKYGKSYRISDGEVPQILSKFPSWAVPGGSGQDPNPEDDLGEEGLDGAPEPLPEPGHNGKEPQAPDPIPAGAEVGPGPRSEGDWAPVSEYVKAHPDLQGSDIARMRKEHGEDARLIWDILQREWGPIHP